MIYRTTEGVICIYISELFNKKEYSDKEMDTIYLNAESILHIKSENLVEMISNDVVKIDNTLLKQIMTKKERKVFQVHIAKISKRSDGRYGTWAKKDGEKRKCFKAPTYERLIENLYDYYFDANLCKEMPTLNSIFEDWLRYKSYKKANKEETVIQNRNSFKKYVSSHEIGNMPLKKIKTIDLETWAIEVLHEHPMTSKKFNTIKIVVTGPLRYSKRKGLIDSDPWQKEEMEYTHLFKKKQIKPSSKMIFYSDEIVNLFEELERGYAKNHNVVNLGLKLNFDLGLRVGELCALKWSDVDFQNHTIFIHRQEDSTGKVVDYVKSDSSAGYRELDLTDKAMEILHRIRRNRKVLTEFLFSDETGKRFNKNSFEHRLARAEKKLGWKQGELKYTHCIRRTVASNMNANRFPIEEIRRWLGHTNKETTLGYLYNPVRESETRKRMNTCSILSLNLNNDKIETNWRQLGDMADIS